MKYINEDNLFEIILDKEIPVSGNDDPANEIKSICPECGRANGEHSIDCDDWFNSLEYSY